GRRAGGRSQGPAAGPSRYRRRWPLRGRRFMTSPYIIRPLTTLEECRTVVALEKRVWGYTDAEDVVPAPVLIVSIKRGGVLLGAFNPDGEMSGFVYSIPGWKNGVPTQWSHMLGVVSDARAAGLGRALDRKSVV